MRPDGPISALRYPPDDDVPYLSSNGGRFRHVFVAFEPFVAPAADEFLRHASWAEIARLCGFSSARRISRALRSTPPGRLREELRSPADRANLESAMQATGIAPPNEGRMSEPTLRVIQRMLEETGTADVWVSGNFGLDERRIPSCRLIEEGRRHVAEIATPDADFYAAIWTNYSYTLLFQTAAHRRRFDPSAHLEGFEADETTDDFWGVRFPPTI